MVTWSCLGFPFKLVPISTFLACCLTAGSPSKTMCVVLSLVCLKELEFWGWWSVSLWTSLCCFVAVMNLFFQSLSIVLLCGGLLLSASFSFPSARCIRWPGFALIRVSCRCHRRHVAALYMLYKVNSNSNLCLFSELSYASVRVWHTQVVTAAHPFLFEVSWCRTSQFARCFLPAQTRVWNDFPLTVFGTGTIDGFKGAVNRWLLPWVCFSVFRGAGAGGVA